MREKYWELYERIKYSERYYFYVRESAMNTDRLIKGFLVIASLSSIANLGLWGRIPFLWAIVTVIAQAISAIAYLIPSSYQATAINYLLPELDHLLNQIDHDWDRINILQELSDTEINDLVFQYNEEFSRLENKFIGNIQVAPNSKCVKKATEDCKKFKFTRFGITQTDYLEEALNDGNPKA